VPPPSRIARYEPEELLGSAGLVDTYRVRVQGEAGLAVLKVLFLDRGEGSITRSIAERFLAAGRRALASPAPGIARVLEVSDDPETAFVATELVPGVDVARLVQLGRQHGGGRGPMLEPVVAGLLCAQVARVLAAAHERKPPLPHLGLCPENVMVTTAGRVMVLDFGLAASLRGMGGGAIEKWHFVAPELIGVDAVAVSDETATAADLYSLGALLYFLLSGNKPVEAATLAELSERAWEPLPDAPGVPNNLLSAVRALSAPDPKDRPESARTVVEWLSGESASPPDLHLAKALQALGIHPPEPAAPAAPAKPDARPVAFAKPVASASSRASVRPKGESTQAVRPGARRWRSRALLAGGALLVCGISAWSVATYRGSRGQAPPPDAGQPPPSATPEDRKSKQVETMVQRAPDGGLRPGAAEAPPAVEPYVPESERPLRRVPNHLFLDTSPSQADVWVDGVLRGKTPVDLVTGPGSHRVVVIKSGYRMLRAVFDTTRGEYARRGLQRAGFANFGDAILDVQCAGANKYPVVLDDEETGLLCPVSRLPVVSGKHHVGIFVPARKTVMAVEVTIPPGREPKRVLLKE
jgi:hypothetical protein